MYRNESMVGKMGGRKERFCRAGVLKVGGGTECILIEAGVRAWDFE